MLLSRGFWFAVDGHQRRSGGCENQGKLVMAVYGCVIVWLFVFVFVVVGFFKRKSIKNMGV